MKSREKNYIKEIREIVSIETALLLNKLYFDERTIAFYYCNKSSNNKYQLNTWEYSQENSVALNYNQQFGSNEKTLSAPTTTDVLKWIIEKNGGHCHYAKSNDLNQYQIELELFDRLLDMYEFQNNIQYDGPRFGSTDNIINSDSEVKLPICTKVTLNTSINKDIEVGELRLLEAGTKVFSIPLQENITFLNDVVVKITNTIYGSNDYCFGNIQIYSFIGNCFYDKANGDIGFNFSETTKYNHKPRT